MNHRGRSRAYNVASRGGSFLCNRSRIGCGCLHGIAVTLTPSLVLVIVVDCNVQLLGRHLGDRRTSRFNRNIE